MTRDVEVTAAGEVMTFAELTTFVQRARMAGAQPEALVWVQPRMVGAPGPGPTRARFGLISVAVGDGPSPFPG